MHIADSIAHRGCEILISESYVNQEDQRADIDEVRKATTVGLVHRLGRPPITRDSWLWAGAQNRFAAGWYDVECNPSRASFRPDERAEAARKHLHGRPAARERHHYTR